MITAGLGPLHDRHPLVIIAEKGEVEVGAATVRLGADGELAQQPPHGLRMPSVLGIHNSVFEPAANQNQVLLTKATGEQHILNKLRRRTDRERKVAAA